MKISDLVYRLLYVAHWAYYNSIHCVNLIIYLKWLPNVVLPKSLYSRSRHVLVAVMANGNRQNRKKDTCIWWVKCLVVVHAGHSFVSRKKLPHTVCSGSGGCTVHSPSIVYSPACPVYSPACTQSVNIYCQWLELMQPYGIIA